MSSFNCKFCKSVFEEKEMLETHEVLHCHECFKWFSKLIHLKEHEKSHASTSLRCYSGEEVMEISNLKHFKCVKRAFKDRIITYLYENQKEEILHPQEFFNGTLGDLLNLLNGSLKKHIALKYNLELECEYIQIKNEDIYIRSITHRTKMEFLTLSDDVEHSLKSQCFNICTKMSEYQERDSGWSLLKIKLLEININKSSFIRGSKYIPTPQWIRKKHGVFNIQNDDDYCFKWSIIASFLGSNQNLLKEINIFEEKMQIKDSVINFERLEFPLKLKDIKIFEEMNSNISVNVFGCEGSQIVGPYYLTNEVKDHHINLLLLTDEEWSHYVLITDISR